MNQEIVQIERKIIIKGVELTWDEAREVHAELDRLIKQDERTITQRQFDDLSKIAEQFRIKKNPQRIMPDRSFIPPMIGQQQFLCPICRVPGCNSTHVVCQ